LAVWATLITKSTYLPGLLTLAYSLRKSNSAYPLLALYTNSLPPPCLAAIRARGIPVRRIEYIRPASGSAFDRDPRFQDCWSKLAAFALTEYARVVLLDSDMLVLQNMDELMEVELDDPRVTAAGRGTRAFAAGHACVCNPLGKGHYPGDWVRKNCAFTKMHAAPDKAQVSGGSCALSPLGELNSGLLVLNPSAEVFSQVVGYMEEHAGRMLFPDQDVLTELFGGRWVALPYVYNALRTLPGEEAHSEIWRGDRVKNVHYILEPKPWVEAEGKEGMSEVHRWWVDMDRERRRAEVALGVDVSCGGLWGNPRSYRIGRST
ncbi:glycosyltransferase family 8 protein, partial [Candidatus Bathyarchaeota archaeon]|nr:glycosyltransferase family 8 protein [Candidatus Bathyarchaeota archaeon]